MARSGSGSATKAFGSPADMSDWWDAVGPTWIVPGFLQEGAVALLSGRGGTGKSLLVLDLAVRLAVPEPQLWLGCLDVPPSPARKVLLFDGECGPQRLKRRLKELCLGGGLSRAAIDTAFADSRLLLYSASEITAREHALEQLARMINQCHPEVVIIDPLRYFLPPEVENENDNIEVGRVMDDLVRL